jgi:hypothetical protein
VTAAVTSTLPSVRLTAIDALAGLLTHPDRRMAVAAQRALEGLADDDSRQVAAKATATLGRVDQGPPPEDRPPRPKPPEPPEPPEPSEHEAHGSSSRTPWLIGVGALSLLVVGALIAVLVAAGSKEKAAPPTSRVTTPTSVVTSTTGFSFTFPSNVTSPTTRAPATTRPTTPPTTVAPARFVSVFDLGIGECFNPPGETVWSTVRIIPCSESHVYEVIGRRRFDEPAGAMWPGDTNLGERTRRGCIEDFADYVGIPYAQSHFDVHNIYPGQQYWDSGGRQAICLVREPDYSTWTGTAKNSRE